MTPIGSSNPSPASATPFRPVFSNANTAGSNTVRLELLSRAILALRRGSAIGCEQLRTYQSALFWVGFSMGGDGVWESGSLGVGIGLKARLII